MAGKGRSGKVQSRENRNGYLFVMPWILGFFLFTLLPMVFSAILSLCEWDIVTGLSTIEFVGLENFKIGRASCRERV